MVVRAQWRLFVDIRFTLLEDISVFWSWIEDSRPINLMMEGKNKNRGEKNDASPSRLQSFHQKMTSKTRRDGTKMIHIKNESSQDWSDWCICKGNGPILVLMWCFCHSAPGWNYSSWHLAPLMKVNIGDTARTWNLVTFLNWEVGLTMGDIYIH